MSKLISTYLKQLEQPYKDQALYNYNKHFIQGGSRKAISLSQALNRAFDWAKTEEGWDYWNKLSRKILLMHYKKIN